MYTKPVYRNSHIPKKEPSIKLGRTIDKHPDINDRNFKKHTPIKTKKDKQISRSEFDFYV